MALTQGNWIESSVGEDIWQAQCTVKQTASETDAYTLKTPLNLDPTREWTLTYQADVEPDGSALPLEIYAGYAADFAITGDGGTIGATSGSKYADLFDDVRTGVPPLAFSWKLSPDLNVADVVTLAAVTSGLKVKIPVAPYYAFNLNGASALAAATSTYTILQRYPKEGGTKVATVTS